MADDAAADEEAPLLPAAVDASRYRALEARRRRERRSIAWRRIGAAFLRASLLAIEALLVAFLLLLLLKLDTLRLVFDDDDSEVRHRSPSGRRHHATGFLSSTSRLEVFAPLFAVLGLIVLRQCYHAWQLPPFPLRSSLLGRGARPVPTIVKTIVYAGSGAASLALLA